MLDDQNPTPPPPPPAQAAPAYRAPSPYAPYPYQQAAYQQPKRRSPWFWVAIIGGGFAVVALLITAMVWSIVKTVGASPFADDDTPTFGQSIAVIDIDGVILDADKVDKQIERYGDDSSVKAIILHINSPGGGAAASQEIYNDVLRVREEKHKKIVASIESVGASGAYYIASACDSIYANQASVVGSIGVIMEWTNYGDLLKWAKLKPVVIHAGALKDAGDPTRDMTPEEAAYFQRLTDNMYGQFIHDVATGRHTTDEKIHPLATGEVWTGQQALPLGLIDHIGGFRVALMDTAKSVGISGEPSIVRPSMSKKGLAGLLSGDSDDLFPNPSKLLDHAPGFYFLWK